MRSRTTNSTGCGAACHPSSESGLETILGGFPVDWLRDPTDERVQAALHRTCDICKARIKHLCSNTIQPQKPLPGRVVHYGRLTDRKNT
jgi:hypothetical protein